eukprot:6269009-Amphidinium_carterae.1
MARQDNYKPTQVKKETTLENNEDKEEKNQIETIMKDIRALTIDQQTIIQRDRRQNIDTTTTTTSGC